MFDLLNSRERANLARKLASARRRLLDEYDLLAAAPRSVQAGYGIGDTDGTLVTDWLMAGIEAGQLGHELAGHYPPARVPRHA